MLQRSSSRWGGQEGEEEASSDLLPSLLHHLSLFSQSAAASCSPVSAEPFHPIRVDQELLHVSFGDTSSHAARKTASCCKREGFTVMRTFLGSPSCSHTPHESSFTSDPTQTGPAVLRGAARDLDPARTEEELRRMSPTRTSTKLLDATATRGRCWTLTLQGPRL